MGSTVGVGYQTGHPSPRRLVVKRRNEDRREGETKNAGDEIWTRKWGWFRDTGKHHGPPLEILGLSWAVCAMAENLASLSTAPLVGHLGRCSKGVTNLRDIFSTETIAKQEFKLRNKNLVRWS